MTAWMCLNVFAVMPENENSIGDAFMLLLRVVSLGAWSLVYCDKHS